ETGAARLLVLRADVIPQLQMDDRRRVIFFEHDREAVRQRRHLVLQLRRPDGGGDGQSGSEREREYHGNNPVSHFSLIISLALGRQVSDSPAESRRTPIAEPGNPWDRRRFGARNPRTVPALRPAR